MVITYMNMRKMLLKIKSEFPIRTINRFNRIMKMMIKFSGYLAAMTFGAEEIVDLRPEVDNVGQVASQNDDDDDDGDDDDTRPSGPGAG